VELRGGDVGRPLSLRSRTGFSRGFVSVMEKPSDRRVRRATPVWPGSKLCQGVVLTKLLIEIWNGLEGYPSRGEARGLPAGRYSQSGRLGRCRGIARHPGIQVSVIDVKCAHRIGNVVMGARPALSC